MAAAMSSELGNTDKIYALKQECERLGINVLKPNILTSTKRFLVNQDSNIEYGLGAIKGVADIFIEHLCQSREKNNFNDLWDFSKKVDIKLGGKKSLEALSQSGAFDEIAPSRSISIACVSDMLKDGKLVSLGDFKNNEERDSIFLIKCNSELVSIANLKKGYIIPRRNFNN